MTSDQKQSIEVCAYGLSKAVESATGRCSAGKAMVAYLLVLVALAASTLPGAASAQTARPIPIKVPDKASFAIYYTAMGRAVHVETLTRCKEQPNQTSNCPKGQRLIDKGRKIIAIPAWDLTRYCKDIDSLGLDPLHSDFRTLSQNGPWVPDEALYAIYYNAAGERIVRTIAEQDYVVAECLKKDNGSTYREMLTPMEQCKREGDDADCPDDACPIGFCAFLYNGVQYCKRC